LIGLAKATSDVDLIIYGIDAGQKGIQALKKLRNNADLVKPYDITTVEKVTHSRWSDTGLDFDRLWRIEISKILHGLVDSKDYFVRLVRDADEFEKEISSRPLGTVSLRATIKNDRYSTYTPCSYDIQNCSYLNNDDLPKPTELISYRGKFTEQAKKGQRVMVRGTLEKVKYADRSIFRIILGQIGDYLMPIL
jgi:predicted nucleotidyltransferase